MGEPQESVPLFKLALEANPRIEQFWVSYIDALIKTEHFEEARAILADGEKSGVSLEKLRVFHEQLQGMLLTDVGPSQEQINRLLNHYQAGRLSEAEKLAESLTQFFPSHPFGWKVLGVVFKRSGRLYESWLPMQKAVELSPQDAEARSNLGNTLQELGRLEEAEASYLRAIALSPDYAEAHYNLGVTLQELGRLSEAEMRYRRAIALRSDYAEAHNNLGVTLKERDRLEEAEASYLRAIALSPDYAEAHNNLGNILQELGSLPEAEMRYRRAIALRSDYAEAHNNLGVTLRELGKLGESEVSFMQALALNPEYADAHRNLTATKHFLSEDEQFYQMQVLHRNPDISDDHRCHICFALAKASQDLEQFAEAFQFYAEGNALRKRQLGYHKEQDVRLFERLEASHPRISKHSLQMASVTPKHIPVFIVGMPRSGTTLVEQIISSHSLVTGAGELPLVSQIGTQLAVGETSPDAESLTIFRDQYLKGLEQRSNGQSVVTDKMPQNFRFLGLIAAALPEASIIHVRRAPAAVCWSNFTKYFANDSLSYCYSLDDILSYYQLYQGLMEYWHQSLPGRIYELDYELLTSNQEQETHKLVDYLGLGWEEACLSPQDNTRSVSTASNMQVRQKVYQGSSELWQRYRPYLNGALDHLSSDS